MTDQPAASVFRLGDLLDHEELGLRLLTGGPEARRRRVGGAHAIEIERPTAWLEPEWIMLTTGARLRHSARAQRELIAELRTAGAAALGFGVEVVFRRVPPALLEEARTRDFPVLRVPLETPFRDVISTINRALLSTDLRTLQRLSSMQLYLMDALGDADPRQSVVERLATFLDATVLLFSPHGTLLESTGDAPAGDIWREVTARPATVVEIEIDGWHALATPVSAGRPAGWLAVASRRALPSGRLARQAARATAPVLAALGRMDETARAQQQAIRASLLDEMLKPPRHRARGPAAARAASLGVDFAIPARIVVVDAGEEDGRGRTQVDLDGAAASLAEALSPGRAAQLCTRRGSAVVALVRAPEADLDATLGRLIDGRPALVAGVGRPVSDPREVRDSYRDARIALRTVARGSDRRIAGFGDLDLVALLISEASPERIRPKVDEVMGVLRRSPGLHDTLEAYFEHDLDIMRAARALHVHHNTLRYRLGRVEEELGRSLKTPATIALLYVALAAERDAISV
jgi:purine catabolism regulator